MDRAPVPDPSPSDERPVPAFRHSLQHSLPPAFAHEPSNLLSRPTVSQQHALPPNFQQPVYGSPAEVQPVLNDLPAESRQVSVTPPSAIEQQPIAQQDPVSQPVEQPSLPQQPAVAVPPVAVAPSPANTQDFVIPQPSMPMEQAAVPQQSVATAEPVPAVAATPTERSRFLLSENPSFNPPTTPVLTESAVAPSEPSVGATQQIAPRNARPVVKAEQPASGQVAAKRGRFQLPALFNFGSPKKTGALTEQPVPAPAAVAAEQPPAPAVHAPPPPVLIEPPAAAEVSTPRIQVTTYQAQPSTAEFAPAKVEAPPARYLPVPPAPVLFESPSAAAPPAPSAALPQNQEFQPAHIVSDWTTGQPNFAPVVAAPRSSQPARHAAPEVLTEEPGLAPIVSPSTVRRPPPPVLTGEN